MILWKGNWSNERIPARAVERAVRVIESGFAREADRSGEPADHDGPLAHRLDSTAAATDWALGGSEGRPADLSEFTQECAILRVEVIGPPSTPRSPPAMPGSA